MADLANGDPRGLPRGSERITPMTSHEGSLPSEFRRITRALKRRRGNNTSFTGTNKTPCFKFSGGGEGRGTNLDEVVWLIASLKATITQQSDIIEGLRAELKEIKAEQQTLKKKVATETEGIKTQITEELKQIHNQLDTITKSQASIAPVNISPNPSYADVTCTPPVSLPSNMWTLSSFNTTPSNFTNMLYCIVDILRAEDGEGDKMSVGTVRIAVEKEI